MLSATSQTFVTVPLPETSMAMSYSYTFDGSRNTNYFGNGYLSYPGSGCTGTPVLWATVLNGTYGAQFGVTLDGKYAYPGEAGVGTFARASYVAIDQFTGAITCMNDVRNISYSEAIISSKDYVVPLAEPVILEWR